MSDYLIWSNEHRGWWGPGRRGYVPRVEQAGRYSEAAALDICTDAMPGRLGDEPLQEIPVRLEDVTAMLRRWTARYPGIDAEPKP